MSVENPRRIGRAVLVVAASLAAALAPLGSDGAAQAKPAAKPAAAASVPADFAQFLAGLWPEARAAGVSRETFDDALKGVTPDPKIVALTRKQSEFVRPISDYVAGAAAPSRLAKSREMEDRYASTLQAVESRYGVPRHVVMAVWGMESGFGANTGGFYVIRSLATLAHARYRGDFFRGELIQALQILEDGHVDRAGIKGSWAGAMGQTQFIPSSYRLYAVDQDGDGHPNIWTSAPDALASTANYLRQKGWVPSLPWGFEVGVPGTADLSAARRSFAEWAALGVERLDGEGMPRSGEASLFMPMGVRGPAFLVTSNFEVIRAYNSSDSYALGVGYLANRLAGGPALSRGWPAASEQLKHEERQEVQRLLGRRGLYAGEADGRHGAKTREAIRAFQLRAGLTADGYADYAVLKALRGER